MTFFSKKVIIIEKLKEKIETDLWDSNEEGSPFRSRRREKKRANMQNA